MERMFGFNPNDFLHNLFSDTPCMNWFIKLDPVAKVVCVLIVVYISVLILCYLFNPI